MLRTAIPQSKTSATGMIGKLEKTLKYVPIPTRAQEALSIIASHVPIPAIVPNMGPMLRSTNT